MCVLGRSRPFQEAIFPGSRPDECDQLPSNGRRKCAREAQENGNNRKGRKLSVLGIIAASHRTATKCPEPDSTRELLELKIFFQRAKRKLFSLCLTLFRSGAVSLVRGTMEVAVQQAVPAMNRQLYLL